MPINGNSLRAHIWRAITANGPRGAPPSLDEAWVFPEAQPGTYFDQQMGVQQGIVGDLDDDFQRPVVVYGSSQSGKSMYQALAAIPGMFPGDWELESGTMAREFTAFVTTWMAQRQEFPPPSPEARLVISRYMAKKVGTGEEVPLLFTDFAGECCGKLRSWHDEHTQPSRMAVARTLTFLLTRAAGLMVLIDPGYTPDEAIRVFNAMLTDLDFVKEKMGVGLGKRTPLPVALCLTKTDRFYERDPLNGNRFDLSAAAIDEPNAYLCLHPDTYKRVRRRGIAACLEQDGVNRTGGARLTAEEFLHGRGGSVLINVAQSFSEWVRCYAVSVTGILERTTGRHPRCFFVAGPDDFAGGRVPPAPNPHAPLNALHCWQHSGKTLCKWVSPPNAQPDPGYCLAFDNWADDIQDRKLRPPLFPTDMSPILAGDPLFEVLDAVLARRPTIERFFGALRSLLP